MYTIRRLLFALALVVTPLTLAAPADAQPYEHTWISNTGTDSSTCGAPATPCATFQVAYNNTATAGEITCLNSGDYQGLGITHSITIDCQYSIGGAGILSGFSVFNITAPAGSIVLLRGLDFDAAASGFCSPSGTIGFTGGGELHLQKIKLNHNTNGCSGIDFAPTANATLDIVDSDITDNGSSGTSAGISIVPASGIQANVTITRTQVQGNFYGIFADGTQGGTIRGTISDSVVSGSTENGVTAFSSGASVVLIIDQTKIAGNNAAGLVASGSNAALLVRYSTVFGNAIGLRPVNGGAIYSYGTNSIAGNPTEGSFTGAAALQ